MKNRTVFIILGVLAALGAFIFVVERGSMTTNERKQREERLFREFQRDDVSRLSVKRATGETIVLQKRSEEAKGDGSDWRLVEPLQKEADDAEVRSMLAALDFLLEGRSADLDKATGEDPFGLKKPRLTGWFEIRGRRTAFNIGADAPGEKVYLTVEHEPSVVHAVSAEILESLDKGASQLRSRRLMPKRVGEAVSMDVHGVNGDYRLSRPAILDAWQVDTPDGPVLAAASVAGELLTHLDGLRAESFVADDVTTDKLGDFGLAAPVATVTLGLPGDQSVKVLVGPTCGEGSHTLRVLVEGSGTIACVDDHLLRLTSRPMEALEERRLLVLREDAVRQITLRTGEVSLVLERQEDTWHAPQHQEIGLEDSVIQALLESLGQPAVAAPVLGKVAADALGKAAVTVDIDVGEGLPALSLSLFGPVNGRVLARRGSEPAVLETNAALLEQAQADVLVFRERRLRLADKDKLSSVSTEGPVVQTVTKQDGKWSLKDPIAQAADSMAARELGERLAEIEVARWVSAAVAPAHGLAKPYAVLRASFELPGEKEGDAPQVKNVALRLGALVPGQTDERFAQQEGAPLVFVVGRSYLEAAQRPLLARDVLQVDDTAITRLVLTAAGVTRSFQLSSGAWAASDGSVDVDKLRRLLTDFGTAKTVRTVGFGPSLAKFGPAVATAAIFTDDQEKPLKTITIGSLTADQTEEGHLARVDGLDATVVMPKRIVDEILSFVSAPAE